MKLDGHKIVYKNRKELYAAIYEFFQRPDLVNPEITLFSSSHGEACTQTYSRNGSFGEEKIPGKEEWKKLMNSAEMYGFLCVAGTDAGDDRRVSVAYVVDGDPAIYVNFPSADKRLTGKEQRILLALQGKSDE